MPIGVIICTISVFTGGILGTLLKKHISDDAKTKMNMIFGACAMFMGVASMALVENLSAVVFSIVFGTAIGIFIKMEKLINKLANGLWSVMGKALPASAGAMSADAKSLIVTTIVLFCCGSTGIYGSMISGMTGDHSILITKSILDFATAIIFACSLGPVVSLVSIPECVLYLSLFILSNLLLTGSTPAMINDFKACGGVLLIATGFRIIKVKEFPVADMIPAMLIVMPISNLWTSFIVPLVS